MTSTNLRLNNDIVIAASVRPQRRVRMVKHLRQLGWDARETSDPPTHKWNQTGDLSTARLVEI